MPTAVFAENLAVIRYNFRLMEKWRTKKESEEMKSDNLHLIGMKVKNFLKIENFDYQFDGKSVKLVGANAAGKTSLFQAIWSACKGKSAIPPDSIHNDAEKGEISLDFGPYIVRRTITKNNAYLDIMTKDGAKLMNPQSVLDGLIGEIALDPHAFMSMSPEKQALAAATIFGLRDALDKADEKIKEAFSDRAYANRKVKELEAKANTLRIDEPEGDRIDVQALTDQLVEIDDIISNANRLKIRGEDMSRDIASNEKAVEELQARIDSLDTDRAELEEAIAVVRKEYSAETKKAAELPHRESTQEQLATAQETNNLFVAWDRFSEAEKEAQEATNEAEALNKKVDALRNGKSDTIKKAKVTVPGLEFGDGILMLNGHPFETASYAERLRTSIAILMAQSPKLKLLTIQDATLMDSSSWKVVEDFAKENDFQVLYEVVGEEAPDTGLFIEDGSLAAIDGKKVEKKVD